MKILLPFLAFALICCPLLAQDDISVSSLVDKTELYENESLTLEVNIDFKGKNNPTINPPGLEDFRVVATSQSQNITREEKDVVYKIKLVYLLLPKKTGNLTIGPFSVQTPEKTYKTDPITVEIKPAEKEEKKDYPPQENKEEIVIPPGGVTI